MQVWVRVLACVYVSVSACVRAWTVSLADDDDGGTDGQKEEGREVWVACAVKRTHKSALVLNEVTVAPRVVAHVVDRARRDHPDFRSVRVGHSLHDQITIFLTSEHRHTTTVPVVRTMYYGSVVI